MLAAELGFDGSGHLLDVGCGPGVLAVQLAGLVDGVTALDPDAAMLDQARWHAAASGIEHIEFVQARAEDIASLGLAPMRLVTFGQSFHRTDRLAVAEAVYDLLEPGGALVLVVHDPDHAALSMSYAAPHLFGDQLDGFIGELRALLAASTTTGRFWDWPGDTAAIIARRPGRSRLDAGGH